MKTLVVGNGAREHAIAWKILCSPLIDELYVAPGNAGTASIAINAPVQADDIPGLLNYARKKAIEFVVVGPEMPLAAGIVDVFEAEGFLIFGPTQAAAQLESSKTFAKKLMLQNGVPTGKAAFFDSLEDALEYVETCPIPTVIKADGLSAGKGVILAYTRDEARHALLRQMQTRDFGDAGDSVLVEEFLTGPEVSVFAFVHGEYVSPFVSACDYKRQGDGDTGPNTGGLGSYSPAAFWTDDLQASVRHRIIEPVAKAMCAIGAPYKGVLYAGLMLTDEGPKVIEFNCRLGDPEAQVVIPRLKSDLAEVMMNIALGRMESIDIEWDPRDCVGVVLTSGGYPDFYDTGLPIYGLEDIDRDCFVFHAGTRRADNDREAHTVTSGGRVLTVAALGHTLDAARDKVYANAGRVSFEGRYYRSDIAQLG